MPIWPVFRRPGRPLRGIGRVAEHDLVLMALSATLFSPGWLSYHQGVSDTLEDLFSTHFGESVQVRSPLAAHASSRQLVRLQNESRSVLGVISECIEENRAFISFARHFRSAGLNVPEIYAVSADLQMYIEQDLGDTTLYDYLQQHRGQSADFPPEVEALYVRAAVDLSRFQIEAAAGVDYSLCYQGGIYNAEAMRGDTRYFEREFLGRTGIAYNKSVLEAEFENLISYLERSPQDYFLYRDFQARNIMLHQDQLYFIDFQTGRRGPLQYDLASLLYQAQARIPGEVRQRVLRRYIDAVSPRVNIVEGEFQSLFYGFVIMRLIQVLGAYGKLGLGDGKEYFRNGIPAARETLRELFAFRQNPVALPEFQRIINA